MTSEAGQLSPAGLSISPHLLSLGPRGRRQLSGWSRWLIDLGRWISRPRGDGYRTCLVLSLPTRDYAAAFVTLGIVAAKFRDGTPTDLLAHFEELAALPPGTPVRFRRPNTYKVVTSRFDGIGEARFNGEPEPVVQLSHGLGGRYSRVWSNCADIAALPPGVEPAGRERLLSDAPRFVEAVLGVDAGIHGLYSSPDCLIVGTKRLLSMELATRLACDGHRGRMQDLIRARALLHQADGYRCDLMSASSDPRDLASASPSAGVVVLDGPSAILRWRHAFTAQPVVYIIDRTSPTADAARDAVLSDRARSTGDVALPERACPDGIEALSYEDAAI